MWAHTPTPRSPGAPALFWILALVIGFVYATKGFNLAPNQSGKVIALGLICFHCLSLFAFGIMFIVDVTGAGA